MHYGMFSIRALANCIRVEGAISGHRFLCVGGGDRTPHGNKIYFKGGGLSPTSTAVSSGERGGMISRF